MAKVKSGENKANMYTLVWKGLLDAKKIRKKASPDAAPFLPLDLDFTMFKNLFKTSVKSKNKAFSKELFLEEIKDFKWKKNFDKKLREELLELGRDIFNIVIGIGERSELSHITPEIALYIATSTVKGDGLIHQLLSTVLGKTPLSEAIVELLNELTKLGTAIGDINDDEEYKGVLTPMEVVVDEERLSTIRKELMGHLKKTYPALAYFAEKDKLKLLLKDMKINNPQLSELTYRELWHISLGVSLYLSARTLAAVSTLYELEVSQGGKAVMRKMLKRTSLRVPLVAASVFSHQLKSEGLHTLASYVSNIGLISTEGGYGFYTSLKCAFEKRYGPLDEVLRIVKRKMAGELLKEDGRLIFKGKLKARIKAPYELLEKAISLKNNGNIFLKDLNKENIVEKLLAFHDLVGIRYIIDDHSFSSFEKETYTKKRQGVLGKVNKQIKKRISKKGTILWNREVKTSSAQIKENAEIVINPEKRYSKHPKEETGYDRDHYLFLVYFGNYLLPVELQVDTASNNHRIEQELPHGVQKNAGNRIKHGKEISEKFKEGWIDFILRIRKNGSANSPVFKEISVRAYSQTAIKIIKKKVNEIAEDLGVEVGMESFRDTSAQVITAIQEGKKKICIMCILRKSGSKRYLNIFMPKGGEDNE